MRRRLSSDQARLLQEVVSRRRPELSGVLSIPLAEIPQDVRAQLAQLVSDEMIEHGLADAEPGKGSVLTTYGLTLDDLIGVLVYQDE